MRVRVEFTTEPFHGEGEPPEHVRAAADTLAEAGLQPDLGPFGTCVDGPSAQLLPALAAALQAALRGGATRVTVQLERVTDAE